MKIRRFPLAITLVAFVCLPPANAQNTDEAEARAKTPHKAAKIVSGSPSQLIAVLKDSNADQFAKAKACQQLSVVGDVKAVPALAALLTDPKLSHYARFGLEPIPGDAADHVFESGGIELRDPRTEQRGGELRALAEGVLDVAGLALPQSALGDRESREPQSARRDDAADRRRQVKLFDR